MTGAARPPATGGAVADVRSPKAPPDRPRCPVVADAGGAPVFRVVTRDAVVAALRDPALTVEHPFRGSRQAIGPSMLDVDGPGHDRLRAAVAPLFRPPHVGALRRNVVRPIVCDVLRGVGRRTDAALRDIAEPIPRRVTAALLGFEADLAEGYVAMLQPLVEYLDAPGRPLGPALDARDEFVAATSRVPRRDAPVRAMCRVAGLTQREEENMVLLLAVAGTVTTTAAIGQVLACLAMPSGRPTHVRLDLAPIGRVVRESLRHHAPLHAVFRFARHPTVLAGTAIPPGAAVELVLGTANRDMVDGERFDPSRAPAHDLTFGAGAHGCLGAALAIVEIEETVRELCRMAPAGVEVTRPPGASTTGVTFRKPVEFALSW